MHRTGDVMMDAVRENLPRALARPAPSRRSAPGAYYLATVHRQENVDDADAAVRASSARWRRCRFPTVFPVHPRTRRRAGRPRPVRQPRACRLVAPQPYLAMLRLVKEARAVLTDSGGLQKEAFILGTPCVTLRDTTEWVETVESGANRLAGADPAEDPRRGASRCGAARPRWSAARVYGDGRAAERIAEIIRALPGRGPMSASTASARRRPRAGPAASARSAARLGNPPGMPMDHAPALRAISTSSGLSPT